MSIQVPGSGSAPIVKDAIEQLLYAAHLADANANLTRGAAGGVWAVKVSEDRAWLFKLAASELIEDFGQ